MKNEIVPQDMLKKIKEDLSASISAKTQQSFPRFFKHEVQFYGVPVPVVRKIAKKYFKNIKPFGKKALFSLCEKLFHSKLCEEAFIAASWLDWISEAFLPEDIATFERWIDLYIDDWAKCDTLCTHAMGSFIMKYPSHTLSLKRWTLSSNLFVRRSAAVSLILPARKGLFLKEIFEVSDALLLDTEDLVQKGYGWMLKVASQQHPEEVLSYLMHKKNIMPRTALRYALEKFDAESRRKAMKRASIDL